MVKNMKNENNMILEKLKQIFKTNNRKRKDINPTVSNNYRLTNESMHDSNTFPLGRNSVANARTHSRGEGLDFSMRQSSNKKIIKASLSL
jgi:hypothetical protein